MQAIEGDVCKGIQKDPIDSYLAAYQNASGILVGLTRLSEGLYVTEQKKKHHFIMKKENLMMRSGAGIQDAHKFLDKQVQKLSAKALKPIVKIDTMSGSVYTGEDA